jgi:hypothetical protein
VLKILKTKPMLFLYKNSKNLKQNAYDCK